MHNEDQYTFVFMQPNANKDALMAQRDLIKESIQQNLTHHRQLLREVCSVSSLLFSILGNCQS
jgi:hypothetical protein